MLFDPKVPFPKPVALIFCEAPDPTADSGE